MGNHGNCNNNKSGNKSPPNEQGQGNDSKRAKLTPEDREHKKLLVSLFGLVRVPPPPNCPITVKKIQTLWPKNSACTSWLKVYSATTKSVTTYIQPM
jgi:hypothetical protein